MDTKTRELLDSATQAAQQIRAEKTVSFLCRLGLHRWDLWQATGITGNINNSGIRVGSWERFERECPFCGLVQRKLIKEIG